MATSSETPSTGAQRPSDASKKWADEALQVLKQQNQSGDSEERASAFRTLLRERTLNDLQLLAEKIGENRLDLSQLERRELAARVRELDPRAVEALAEDRTTDERLAALAQREALLALVSGHLKPGIGMKSSGMLEGLYKRVASMPNFIGDFFRKQGEKLSQMAPNKRTALLNQVLKGFYAILESPQAVASVLPLPGFISKFADKFREKRTRIEVEERIFVAINQFRRSDRPQVTFTGFDEGSFAALKKKHRPKDLQDTGMLEQFTPAMRVAILGDVSESTRRYLEYQIAPGNAPGKTIVIDMQNLVDFDPEKKAKERQETAALDDPVLKRAGVKAVEFGPVYGFSKVEGKLTIPKEAMDESGASPRREFVLLRNAVEKLSSFTQEISVVPTGGLELGAQKTVLPADRSESIADYAKMFGFIQGNPKLSILRSTLNQTMRGDIQYVGDNAGRGILEWKSGVILHPATDLQSFFSASPSLLSQADPGTQWKKGNGGVWERVSV